LAPVILAAAGITMDGYGTLSWSSYPPLRSIGIVSAASTIALAVASVLLLPALLLSTPRTAPAEAGLGAADAQAR
jgi:predicted RND superfamily exporter protein